MFKRLRKKLRRLNSDRYRRFVPKDIRQLSESRGVPPPSTYVPDASGRRVSVKRLMAIRDRRAARQREKKESRSAWID